MMFIAAAALVFIAVVCAVVGITLQREGAAARALGDRLKSLGFGGRDLPELDAQRDSRYSSMPWFDRILRALSIGQNLELLIYQAGMNLRPGVLILLIAAFGMGGYFLGVVMMHRVLPALLFMMVAAPLPYLYVVNRKTARMKAFAHEFPDALDLLVSGLRAGLSFTAAMQIVSEESPDPVRGEFAITVEEQALGIDFREALVNLTKRVDSLDLRFFVTAVLLQRDTGGNLAEILHNTALLIRDRFRILGDIQTFTAQGRLTGAILSALPIGMALYMLVMAPGYFRPMLEAHTGRVALGIAAGMQLLGYLVIRKIVQIKV
jgi:tight adherence protein B